LLQLYLEMADACNWKESYAIICAGLMYTWNDRTEMRDGIFIVQLSTWGGVIFKKLVKTSPMEPFSQ
jgi:hypothetical protein